MYIAVNTKFSELKRLRLTLKLASKQCIYKRFNSKYNVFPIIFALQLLIAKLLMAIFDQFIYPITICLTFTWIKYASKKLDFYYLIAIKKSLIRWISAISFIEIFFALIYIIIYWFNYILISYISDLLHNFLYCCSMAKLHNWLLSASLFFNSTNMLYE